MTSGSKSRITRPPYINVVLTQFVAALCIATVASFFSTVHGYSSLLGGLICAIPNAWFAFRSFEYQGARAAQQIVKNFYRAEAIKLGLTAVLFGLTFKLVDPLEPLTLFVTFFLVQVVHWFTPLLIKR